ncbi:MBL fold metallo-hydrolase [Sphingomonas turrisvirgatae]|uniref:MBL fold metallo-hydrolase n=1 Tax=Sphingomonas turrisvirgatae TaxID=1888892 RepID=A0A1E3LQX2_9SPHN|nr:MBL fold metallo-hydrolase [Sphingomonas turrisvirgatae]ODP36161.1 MBL fold metallo-hydrolase [Sphingomonas turrisvirgatae]
MKVRILGSGTSSGVPRIGNDWGACDPGEPRNRRSRASILIESDTTRILVDTSPDMREQLLAANVDQVDAVIWTHDHADHAHGIDDLRQLMHAQGGPVRGIADAPTRRGLTERFRYVFAGGGPYRATATLEPLNDGMVIGNIAVRSVDQPHGGIVSAGLRFECDGKSVGYATDFSKFTESMWQLYAGVDLWVADALRRHPHPTHPHLAQTLQWATECQVGRTILVHMDNSMDYRELVAELPAGVEPGFDGMEVVL